MFIGNIIVMVYAIIYCNTLSFKKETDTLKLFEKIDEDLFGLKLGKEMKRKNDFLKKATISLAFFNYFIFYFLSTISIYFGFNRIDEELSWKLYETMAPIMIISTTKSKFYVSALIFKTRTQIINEFLKQKINNCSSHIKQLEKLEVDIEIALKIHKKIVDAVRHLNNVFGFMILITFILSFILLLSDGYIVLYCLTVGKENNLFHIFSSTRLLLFYSVELFLSMRTTTLLCAEVNETKNILFNVKIEPENVDTRNVIMVSVFKLMHDKLELKACELFNMDLTFVFSMFASLTTYLLILLQFDIDSIQRKAANFLINETISLSID
ncbi:putative gustatory receptor 28a [Onthophagus taurus]|uniref:putative gustatory receptor 28a n=1 Tax=Onthophagus taurus TaxID=166361 RepID=UPI0039BDA635